MRDIYPHLFRVLDKIKVAESKQESIIGLKKEETIASMAEEVRHNLTKSMQQTADLKNTGEGKQPEEPSLLDLTGVDLSKYDKKAQTELFKKMVKQIEVQKLRIETLKKSEPNSIAEMQAILEDLNFYDGKLKRQQQLIKQTKGVIDSQARLLAKDGSKK